MRLNIINYSHILQRKKLQCPYMDTDSFGLSMKTEIFIKDFKDFRGCI